MCASTVNLSIDNYRKLIIWLRLGGGIESGSSWVCF